MIQWKADFETGIPSADYEHRKLTELINELHERAIAADSAEDAARSLDRIIGHFSAHFANEEEAMRDLGFAGLQGHRVAHNRLIALIDDVIECVERGAPVDIDLPARLDAWFVQHFIDWDAPLHRFLDRVA